MSTVSRHADNVQAFERLKTGLGLRDLDRTGLRLSPLCITNFDIDQGLCQTIL